MESTNRRFAILVSAVVLAAASGLYLWAWVAAGGDFVFGGLLFNPLDGNTYLAKAYQGFAGSWRFRLPYTAEPGDGAYINLYYLFIGHFARWTGLSIPLIYNLARLAGAGFMLAALWSFYRSVMPVQGQYRSAFAIASLTLGMGWLLIPAGVVPMDLWVAEAYPLLAAVTNPHFPLALGLIAMLANPVSRFEGSARFARDLLLSLILALVSPFAVVIAGLPWAAESLRSIAGSLRGRAASITGLLRQPEIARILAIAAGGLPVVLYDLLAIQADPMLALWDQQNQAWTPPWWDLALSLSPALLLAILGFRKAPIALRGWFALGLALAFIPIELQRRFLMGVYIPLAALASVGLAGLKNRALRTAALIAFLPAPLILVMTASAGIGSRSPLLYLTVGEHAALEWIETNTDPDALILAGPETGLFIPAYTGRRVLYGHPFETIDAMRMKSMVEGFYALDDPARAAETLDMWEVDYVFYGPREEALGPLPDLPSLQLVYAAAGVRIYAVEP